MPPEKPPETLFCSIIYFHSSVRDEIRQNIQRLQHHPSIAIWATNNENEVAIRQNWYGTGKNFSLYNEDYVKLYVDTIMDEIQKIDKWREVLVSSPSNGNSEKEKENWIANNPQDPHFGDGKIKDHFTEDNELRDVFYFQFIFTPTT
jgi:beta-mannosidase